MNNLYNKLTHLLLIICLGACAPESPKNQGVESPNNTESNRRKGTRAKFEPADGKVILFVGQDLHAIGGLEEYNNGYMDHFKAPGGWTAYTNIAPGDTSFGYVQKGLDGIWSTDDWGDSTSNMNLQAMDEDFKNMALAIGLSLVNHEKEVANGDLDSMVVKLGEYLKSLAPRPVFLRIGYEFDGHSWNHYDREAYLTAYKRIKDKFDEMGVDNVAYVWQSTGWVSDQYMLEQWYPGDDYVDWCAFSFFARWKEQEMIEFARKKDKPVFIAEASPTISDFTIKFDGDTKETILSDDTQADEAWERWFEPFFQTIDENDDVVKAISYINCYWKAHEMWKGNATFRDIDARLQTNQKIIDKWNAAVDNQKFVHASESLFEDLKNNQ